MCISQAVRTAGRGLRVQPKPGSSWQFLPPSVPTVEGLPPNNRRVIIRWDSMGQLMVRHIAGTHEPNIAPLVHCNKNREAF